MTQRICSIENCVRPSRKRGWCALHYNRWHRHDDPLIVRTPHHWTRRHLTPSGYVRVWDPDHPAANNDGYALEHRKVWMDAHGAIPEGVYVHHVDGDKTNNDLSNLQLMDASSHAKQHVRETGYVVNQYGTWPLRTSSG